MAKQEKDWNEGDRFVFTESPFPAGSLPTEVYTLGTRQSDPENKFQYFDVSYTLGSSTGTITVAAHWIKEPGNE